MNRKIITICVLMLVTIPVLTVTANDNTQPSKPIITGKTNGIIGKTYDYTISSVDTDGDDVYYEICWGDCLVIKNAGPYISGEEVIFSHSWCEVCCGPGDFTIYVQATDDNGGQSDWGTLVVTMNKYKVNINTPILNFLENHLRLFPLLRQLLKV